MCMRSNWICHYLLKDFYWYYGESQIGTFLRLQVEPEIKLKTCVQNYRPSDAKVVPLGERDVIPVNRFDFIFC